MKPKPKPKIWAHTLFKNEDRWLWYSVKSVIDYVDRLLLWDTGSTDNSVRIAESLKNIYKDKIDFRKWGGVDAENFTRVRQAMLDETTSDWFIVLDGDEIWWRDSINKVITVIDNSAGGGNCPESIVVPTINLVGDPYHFQEEKAGRYKFGNLEGHYNLRAVKRDIEGLHSEGAHGVWGWADSEGRQIQDRNTFKFVDAPYLHATFLQRGSSRNKDIEVVKRKKKFKYEFGITLPTDFFYPEAFFETKPDFVPTPWFNTDLNYKFRAFWETPLRKIKRRLISGKTGY